MMWFKGLNFWWRRGIQPLTDTLPNDDLEYDPEFTGCTCWHDPGRHGVDGCDDCDCKGHWVE